jgi:hypothetical protein
MSTASVFRIVTQTLQKRKVAAKWVPHQLSDEQKAARKRVAEELLQRYCLRCSIGKFGKVLKWQVLPHPPYSPKMSPPDFDLFPKLKKPLRGKRSRSTEEVSNEVTRVIRRIKNEGVVTGIQDLPKRWTAVIKHNGDYIEGL